MSVKRSLLGIGIVCAAIFLAGCDPVESVQKPVNVTQAQKAADAANSIIFTDNAEIENIKKRVELTSKPGLLGYITLLNQAGQPILYEAVKGKITSGGKRLRNPQKTVYHSNTASQAWVLEGQPSDEGTYGSSGDYIFYWNTDGVYRQWSGDYLYSDKPYRLRTEPLVLELQQPRKPD